MKGTSGNLQIRDGNSETNITLDPNQLRMSSITYTQITGRLLVRMRVTGADPTAASEEFVEYVGPADRAPLVPLNDTRAAVESAPAVAEPTTRQVPSQPAEAPPPVSQAPKRKFELKVPAPPPGSVATLPVVAPAVAPPVAPVAVPSSLPDLIPRPQAPPPPAPTPKVTPVGPSYTGPKSGRLIWTGQLARRGVIEIEGGRVSVGSLSGALSGVPSDYRIAPAEFTHNGLAIYTSDSTLNGRKEPPSKENGWNTVHFEFSPERSGELVVLEAPSRINNFNRLVLRNDAKTCPVIVVDWNVHPDARN